MFFLAGTVSLLLVYVILWMQMIVSPAERTGTDFIAFYTAGRVAQEHGIPNVYNIAYQQDVQENLLGFSLADNQPLLYNHLPFLVPLLALITQDNYVASFFLWMLIQLALYGASFYILAQLPSNLWTDKTRRNLVVSGILFFPIFVSLLLGQDTAFLFLGVSLFVYGALHKKDPLSGIGLALTTVRPHLTLVLALPLLFKNRKAFGYFSIFGGLLALFSVGILGLEGTRNFIQILTISGEGTWYGMKETSMFNLIGLLTRAFTFLDPNAIHIIGWSAYILSTIILSLFWVRAETVKSYQLSLAILFSIFFAPHLHYHDLSLLIIPILLVLGSGKLPVDQNNLPLVPLAISLLLIFTQPVPALYFSLPYFLLILLVVFMQKNRGWASR